jgi:hypothetical protein
MFFGHIAVGLAAKGVAPKASLGALLLSTTAIDTLAGVFAIAGIETVDASGNSSIPWSHGLFMAVVWAILGAALAFLLSRDRRVSAVIGLVVFSHWVLDFISHPMSLGGHLPPDLPLLFEGSPKVGLGLYNHCAAASPTPDVSHGSAAAARKLGGPASLLGSRVDHKLIKGGHSQ